MNMVPRLITDLKIPIIYWYQNDAEVVIRVLLHDVENYFLRVKTDEFEFSTKNNDVDYYVYLRLFGAVIAEETCHVTTGREVKIYLPKVHKWTAWTRLLHSTIKPPQIFFDVDHIDTIKPKKETCTWDENEFANYKKNYFGPIMPDVPSSDENDSADEGYNYLFQ